MTGPTTHYRGASSRFAAPRVRWLLLAAMAAVVALSAHAGAPSSQTSRSTPTAQGAPTLHLEKVRWGMSRDELQRALGFHDDTPSPTYSHFPASWKRFKAPARLGSLPGHLSFYLSDEAGLRVLSFEPARPEPGRCWKYLGEARSALEKGFGRGQETRPPYARCYEWAPEAGGLLMACCRPLPNNEWPDTKLARLLVTYVGPTQGASEHLHE